MEGQATSLLSCTNASGEHTVHWFHLDSHRSLLDLQDKFRSLRWNAHPYSWKQSGKIVIQTSVICVACTNKHVQPLRIEMKPLWSRLKGFEDVDHSIPWKQSVWSRREGGTERESNVLSEAVIVTIHLNDVSITSNQLFCILNQQNTGERL